MEAAFRPLCATAPLLGERAKSISPIRQQHAKPAEPDELERETIGL